MIQEIMNLMQQELSLFQAALNNEKEKRKAILAASGRKLQNHSRKTELLIAEVEKLELKRIEAVHILSRTRGLSAEADLTAVLQIADEDGFEKSNELHVLAVDYRDTAGKLQSETEENERLIRSTGAGIEKMLNGLRDIASPRQKIYEPAGSKKQERKQSGSILVNANA